MAKKRKASSNMQEVQNAAKTLFANIRFMSPDCPLRTIVITSSVPDEGKSTTSIELAKAIATSGKKTLLVEADMRRRSLANALGVRAQAGVYSVLTDAATIEQAVVPTKVHDLYLLDSEPNIPRELEDRFDYVIYDTPPVGTFVDAAILSTLVDGTVLIVKPGFTKRAELQDAYEQLKKADANVIGTCATFCEGTGSEYYYAYYTQDGKRAKPEDRANAPQMPGRSNTPRVTGRSAGANQRGGR